MRINGWHSIWQNSKALRLRRLNALNYSDLRAKLQAPLTAARELLIHATLDERFVDAFRQAVQQNEPTLWDDDQKAVRDIRDIKGGGGPLTSCLTAP